MTELLRFGRKSEKKKEKSKEEDPLPFTLILQGINES